MFQFQAGLSNLTNSVIKQKIKATDNSLEQIISIPTIEIWFIKNGWIIEIIN